MSNAAGTLEAFANSKLNELASAQLRRTLSPTARDGTYVIRDGRRLVTFCCNDYLNLSKHPMVMKAAQDAIAEFGTGAGASRLVTGDHPLLGKLEEKLAKFKGSDAACVFGSGYLANVGIIPTLVGRNDLVFADELSHSCIRAGAKLSGATTLIFKHNDLAELRNLLEERRKEGQNCLIATDGVFSMDGDLAPLAALAMIANSFDCWLLIDDAHGLGVVNRGKGTTPGMDIPLQMGTLSKALGSYGGYVCASESVISLIKTRAASFVYTTGLPPASAAAAIMALEIIENCPALVERPVVNARLFCQLMNLPDPTSSIVPIIIGDPTRALKLSQALSDDGFLISAIRPPTVPAGTSRLRVTFMADHTEAQITLLAKSVTKHLKAL